MRRIHRRRHLPKNECSGPGTRRSSPNRRNALAKEKRLRDPRRAGPIGRLENLRPQSTAGELIRQALVSATGVALPDCSSAGITVTVTAAFGGKERPRSAAARRCLRARDSHAKSPTALLIADECSSRAAVTAPGVEQQRATAADGKRDGGRHRRHEDRECRLALSAHAEQACRTSRSTIGHSAVVRGRQRRARLNRRTLTATRRRAPGPVISHRFGRPRRGSGGCLCPQVAAGDAGLDHCHVAVLLITQQSRGVMPTPTRGPEQRRPVRWTTRP